MIVKSMDCNCIAGACGDSGNVNRFTSKTVNLNKNVKRFTLCCVHCVNSLGLNLITAWRANALTCSACLTTTRETITSPTFKMVHWKPADSAKCVNRWFIILRTLVIGELRLLKETPITLQLRTGIRVSNFFESGIRCGTQLLKSDKPPTAVFCANDDLAAADLLIKRIRNLSPDDKTRVIESELVIRESTGPAPINKP
jgi:hypothetical protein